MHYNFHAIREHYEMHTPKIIHAFEVKKNAWFTPYSHIIDWSNNFSSIEWVMWQVIRGFGKCPMYPQYPVGNYFADFGHPGIKVAIECDGKEWHQDKQKDLNRDEAFHRMHWTVFRIDGSDCIREVPNFEEYASLDYYSRREKFDVLRRYYLNTRAGLVRAIAICYFDYGMRLHKDELELAFKCLSNRASIGHERLDILFNELSLREIDAP